MRGLFRRLEAERLSHLRAPCRPLSEFFARRKERAQSGREQVTLKVLDLGDGESVEAQRLFESLCARKQAMSPDDRSALTVIVQESQSDVLDWLPAEIPVKENIAIVFGELLKIGSSDLILSHAKPYLKTATDVLRVIAVYSGANPSLQTETLISYPEHGWQMQYKNVNVFKVAKLGRPLRRSILAFLSRMPFERLVEDMLRYEASWINVGEFLHPFEYGTRFPVVASAFAILRKTQLKSDFLADMIRGTVGAFNLAPNDDGVIDFSTFNGRLEKAVDAKDGVEFTRLLEGRPGELARRLDHALRLVLSAGQSPKVVVEAFLTGMASMATPVLTTLLALLPTRTSKAPVRLFWPAGEVAKGVSAPDKRMELPEDVVEPLVDGFARSCSAASVPRPATVTVSLTKRSRPSWCRSTNGLRARLQLQCPVVRASNCLRANSSACSFIGASLRRVNALILICR